MWKQIKDFDKDKYQNELLSCCIWLGVNVPVIMTCKYSKNQNKFIPVFPRVTGCDFEGNIIAKIETSQDMPEYRDSDIRSWCYLTELVDSTKEFWGV